jgi:hypothetical protein
MTDFDGWVPAGAGDGEGADVVESKPDPDHGTPKTPPSWRRWGVPIGLLASGALVGGVLAATLTANAAPTPTPSPSYGEGLRPGVPGPDGGMPGGRAGRHDGHGLDHTGTVTAVGASSVTIKESAGTTTYVVNAQSDIDKNGEAKLSDLKAGDAVKFNVVTVGGKKTIGILHSGNEELNRPQHGPGDRHHFGPAPAPSGSTSGSSDNAAYANT